jgi:hypothetical protein
VDAEHSGEQSSGQFGGELEQCGGAGLCGVETEVAQPFAELEGADRSSGLAAGEQPWGGVRDADGGVSAAVASEGFGWEIITVRTRRYHGETLGGEQNETWEVVQVHWPGG